MFWNPCGLDSNQLDFSAWGFPTPLRKISYCCGAQKVPEHPEVPLALTNINTLKEPLQQSVCKENSRSLLSIPCFSAGCCLDTFLYHEISPKSMFEVQIFTRQIVGWWAWPVQKWQHWLLDAKWDLKYRSLEGRNFVLCGLSVLIIRIWLWLSSFFHSTLLWWLPNIHLQRQSAASYADNEEGQGEVGGRLSPANVKLVPVRQ